MTASVPCGPVGSGPFSSTMSSATQSDIPVDRLANAIGTLSPSSEDVASVAAQLCSSITEQKSALHMCMGNQSDVVSRHLSQANDLHDTVADVNTRLSDMSQAFDARNPRAFPAVGRFVDQSSALSSCAHDQAVAAATLTALDALKSKYNDLVALEDILWDGKGADHNVLLEIVSAKHTTTPSSSQVASAIENRHKILLSMLSEQITSAWVKSITVASQPSEPPQLSVKRRLKLALPHVSRVTKPSHSLPSTGPPSFTSEELIHSLDVLGVLTPRLQEIQSQVVYKVIYPFIDNGNWQPMVDSSGDVASLQMSVVGHQPPAETVLGVKTILSFIATSVCPPPDNTSPSTQARSNFLLAVQKEAFERVLSAIIVPAMPLASGDLPVWLQLVHQAAASEEELQPAGATIAVLRQFVDQEAGGRWLSKRRQALLRKARRIIYNDWKLSGFRQVDIATPTTEEAAVTHVGPEEAAIAADKVLDDELDNDDDGWGFDDKPSEESKATQGNPEDDSSGWDFDDVATPIAPPPVVNSKPTRVAKRLGKRAKQSESVDTPQSLPSTPPREEEPVLQPRAVVTPSPPAPQRHWRRVSLVCDEVVTMANDAAAEMYAVPSLSINDASFASLESGMADQLAEVLDFIRATTPVANLEYAKTSTAVLQLSNDFAYIGETLHVSPAVCSNDLAQHFKSAGSTIYQSFVENQLAIVSSILSGTHHFVDTSSETVFAPAQQAINRLVVYAKQLAVDLDPLFDSQRRDNLLGGVVEAIAVSVVDDILALEDITEAESEKIGLLVGELESLDSQFMGGSDVSAIATFVPHWLKLCYTNEILRANLVDITYLFESGSLVDFTPQELDRLVRALFADSQKRTTLLEKIGF